MKLKQWQSLSPEAKLIEVNHFGNAAIAYTDDLEVFHVADYWATPAESLKGRGDCEDYALLKYASLRDLGFVEDQLRIVIVNDLKSGLGHAVLTVRMASGTYVLDNQDRRVLRDDSISRYAPVYSVNGNGRWINIATRDLKQRKPDPVMLVANAAEPEDITPAAADDKPLSKPVARVANDKPPGDHLPDAAAIVLVKSPEVLLDMPPISADPEPGHSVFERWSALLGPLVKFFITANG